jgi:hypothetical protein
MLGECAVQIQIRMILPALETVTTMTSNTDMHPYLQGHVVRNKTANQCHLLLLAWAQVGMRVCAVHVDQPHDTSNLQATSLHTSGIPRDLAVRMGPSKREDRETVGQPRGTDQLPACASVTQTLHNQGRKVII